MYLCVCDHPSVYVGPCFGMCGCVHVPFVLSDLGTFERPISLCVCVCVCMLLSVDVRVCMRAITHSV